MTKTESAHLTAQTMLLESAEQILQLHRAAGVRLAIPHTNNLIMVGPADWITANVPGVEAMIDAADQASARRAMFKAYCDCYMDQSMTPDEIADKLLDARLAATTQASTAQAESVPIELAQVREQIKEGSGFWHTCSGCHESEDGHDNGHYPHSAILGCKLGMGCSECGGIGAVWDNTDYAAMADDMLSATSSTDAQAAAEVRDAARYRFLREKMCFNGGKNDQATMTMSALIPAPDHNFDTDWVSDRFDASVDETVDRAIRSAGDTGGAR